MPESLGAQTLAPDGPVIAFACAVWLPRLLLLGRAAWSGGAFGEGPGCTNAGSRADLVRDDRQAYGRADRVVDDAYGGGGTVLATLLNLQRVEIGFDADRLATFILEPARSGYDGRAPRSSTR